ncbi:MAG: hypothetical protein KIS80_09335 [Anaerolineales bacterium]|nr:hypothetical protein [Anaerolineales bacterium]
MNKRDQQPHFFLEIHDRKVGFTSPNTFVHAQTVFPEPIHLETPGFLLIGYLASFDSTLNIESLSACASKNDWELLLNSWAEFLLVYLDKTTGTILLMTDLYGRFPCYFAIEDTSFFLSTKAELVIKKLSSKPSLGERALLDQIAGSLFITSETLLKDLFSAPPGCLVWVSSDNRVVIENFYQPGVPSELIEYESESKWLDAYSKLLKELLGTQLDILSTAGAEVGALLSSGLDSTLLAHSARELGISIPCFFLYSDYAPKAENLQAVDAFTTKHDLELSLFDGTDYYPFSDQEDRIETLGFPANINPLRALVSKFHASISLSGVDVVSSGEGGNELYRVTSLDFGRFYLQEQFFSLVDVIRSSMNYLSPKAIRMLVFRENYFGIQTFSTAFPSSAVLANWADFSNYWPFHLWAIHPMQNLHLLKFFRESTINGKPIPSREKLLRNWIGDVFVDAQFESTSNYDTVILRLFTEKFHFVKELLKSSCLARWGLIDANFLLHQIEEGEISSYMVNGGIVQLERLIRAEYYLQTNEIHPYR